MVSCGAPTIWVPCNGDTVRFSALVAGEPMANERSIPSRALVPAGKGKPARFCGPELPRRGMIGRRPPAPDAVTLPPINPDSNGSLSEEKNCPVWSTHWNVGPVSTLFPLTYLSSHASVASRMSFSWPGLIGSRQTPCPPQTHIILTGTPLAASICALVTDCCSGNNPSAVPWISSVGAVMLDTSVSWAAAGQQGFLARGQNAEHVASDDAGVELRIDSGADFHQSKQQQ